MLKTSQIFSNINEFISFYKPKIKTIIEKNIKKKAEIFIDKQATMEIKEKNNLRLENKRTIIQFISTNSICLKRNFYYISQKYILHSILEKIWEKFFELYKIKLNEIIDELIG